MGDGLQGGAGEDCERWSCHVLINVKSQNNCCKQVVYFQDEVGIKISPTFKPSPTNY